jgi:hypothetical protein
LILSDVVGDELLVESVLPGPRQKTSLLRPSWPKVSWLDLHCRAPDLYVGDQASR